MRRKILIIFLVAFLVSTGGIVSKAFADAILFPWIVKSDTVSTYISVINTAKYDYGWSSDVDVLLHYQYWYKTSTANDHDEICNSQSFKRPTSWNDIVTFDASELTNEGKAIFNDTSPYGDLSFKLSPASPRRAFLIVDNNTPFFVINGFNIDGTLSGEALIIDHATGMMWGYTAYNARGTGVASMQTAQVYFNDGFDYQGEVIGGNETSKVVLLPFSEYDTKFYITPIGTSGQRTGNSNTLVYLANYISSVSNDAIGGILLNNEEPIDFTKRVEVACTTALTLRDLFSEAAYYEVATSGKQIWAYIKTQNGTVTENPTAQAAIGKLEYTTVTQTISPDLSDSEGCALCKEACLSKCESKGKKPDFLCKFRCSRTCKQACSPKIEFDTQQGNFNWIRSGQSLPLPQI